MSTDVRTAVDQGRMAKNCEDVSGHQRALSPRITSTSISIADCRRNVVTSRFIGRHQHQHPPGPMTRLWLTWMTADLQRTPSCALTVKTTPVTLLKVLWTSVPYRALPTKICICNYFGICSIEEQIFARQSKFTLRYCASESDVCRAIGHLRYYVYECLVAIVC